jgi:hypothetical protein
VGMSPKAREFVELLESAGRKIAHERGWGRATQISFFCPQWVIAKILGVDPSTIRRWFYRYHELRTKVAMRQHFTSVRAGEGTRTFSDGTVWTIRFVEGSDALRVPLEDLKAKYRDLDADIAEGRTLHGSSRTGVGESKKPQDLILGWAFGLISLPPVPNVACSLEDAVMHVEDGGDPVVLANVVATVLKDRHSVRYWIGQVKYWREQGRLWSFKDWVTRALVDAQEGFARRPAALLVSRLRQPASPAPGSA